MATLADKAYEHLRRKLLDGAFEPGQRLRYGPIGSEIGISATPVREAVGKLASEGLVELVPNLGAIVRSPGRADLAELYEVREGVECFAVRLAAQRIDDAGLAELGEYVQQMRRITHAFRDGEHTLLDSERVQAFNAADLAFHMRIVEAAGNRYIEKTLSDLHVLSHIFESQRLRMYTLSVAARAYAFHRRILRALHRRDGETAARMMAQHIRCGSAQTIAAMRESERPWWLGQQEQHEA